MKHSQFIAAFNRAEASNGPWFSGDDAKDVAFDIRNYCQDDWEEMFDAVDGGMPAYRKAQIEAEIRYILSNRKAG